ncbi:D-alanyl-D-alanine carboxypeptidase family protein [Oecophyllibacter saccharovorans]|uniref:D-alanyl-D-alanine carboxypeptidase n=1 Tax=Oecophyllibacter saccharovorans TaxID=2558360 RepID=A0A506ULF7_9PROT|nr:D-alanyl-D-alanine carboxypeptidase family protein [Oecophyllibacter saccharovorans]QDH15336.1 D-alanyl-D-alanine carboxypeptidase [Oecophyllibacter saccharovorans]TPW34169.1 D-alanyl-D-alanine carboxypeptidase [Oecophyllibacter saccharovorans]TPW36353.1 D-alanyl-D-alanine carboxypeptidase [Oecophyllibacter saccharovorans]
MRLSIRSVFMVCAALVAGAGGTARAQYAGHISSFVMNANTGDTLSQNDADLQRYPASLTKMMTLYLTFLSLQQGRITLDQRMPVSIHSAMQEPSKLGLRAGSELTVEEGILALVTKSANDAACTLGEFLGGGDEVRFADLMTRQARALGMSNTSFRNASGLPDPDQVTTARDMAQLAYHLIKDFPQYYSYFGMPSFRFHGRLIPNHDPLLKTYAGADGLKTGYTGVAGHNLVSSAQQGDTRLIGVVLGAPSNNTRNLTMMALLDNGFSAAGQTPLPHMHVPAMRGSSFVMARYSGYGRSLRYSRLPIGQRVIVARRAAAMASRAHHLVLPAHGGIRLVAYRPHTVKSPAPHRAPVRRGHH